MPPQELDVRRSTTVPAWWALWVLVKYRSSRNFRSGAYLGARLGEALLDSNMDLTEQPQTSKGSLIGFDHNAQAGG